MKNFEDDYFNPESKSFSLSDYTKQMLPTTFLKDKMDLKPP